MKNIISLGAGVQSSVLLFMAAEGIIKPKPDAAIFSDTGEEPESVYAWLEFMMSLRLGFPILIGTKGNVGEDSLRHRVSKKSGKSYVKGLIPVFIKNLDGTKGILPRKCTRDYKIHVIISETRKMLGRPRITAGDYASGPLVQSWIGISTDEAHRMKPSRVPWIVNRWPLIEMGMSREDCIKWFSTSMWGEGALENGFERLPRSACRQCPYHSDREWLRLKNEEPVEFEKAVEWEKKYQDVCRDHGEMMNGTPFLHSSLVTLDKVIFNPNDKSRPMGNECEGLCGV